MCKNKYIIFFLVFLIIALYLLSKGVYSYYVEKHILNEIRKEWVIKTGGGFVKIDEEGSYKGDYYLSISNVENIQSHIHIMTNHRENDWCYLVKKNNLHSKLYFIDKNKTSRELVEEFLQNYRKFHG